MSSTSIYCVSESSHFLGAVALVNSLRLTGHDQPIVVLDCGLEDRQRDVLAREATIIPAAGSAPPALLKWAAPLEQPADVMLLIDVDIIVTRSLAPLLERVSEGKMVAFADALEDRRDARWGPLLDLPEPRRQPYVSTGLLALPRRLGADMLQALRALGARIDPAESMIGHGTPDDPFYFLDQDIINAYLASSVDRDDVVVLEHRLAPHPPFRGLKIVDPVHLRCEYADGVEPFALHHIQRKPWLHSLPRNAYSELLSRLLTAPDLPLRLMQSELPLRLRDGALGQLDRGLISAWAALMRGRRALGLRRRLAGVGHS